MKIVLSVALAMFLVGCSSDESQSSKKEAAQTKSVVQTSAPKAEVKAEAVQKQEPVIQEVKKEVKKVAKEVQAKVEEAPPVQIPMKVEKVKEAKRIVASNNGKAIFQACSACHGQKAEKKALGRSQIIQGWAASKIEKALHGYKDGSYGGAMKGVMQAQASKLSDTDIKAVADYISKL